MIVDYKIILILILAIVVLIIYNKIEYVKSDVNKLEEKNSKLEDEIYELQKKISFVFLSLPPNSHFLIPSFISSSVYFSDNTGVIPPWTKTQFPT